MRKKSIPSRMEPRGFTTTELAIVLGVMAIVLGGIWVAAANVSSARRISKTVEQSGLVAQNIRDYYRNINRIPGACNNTFEITATLDALNAGIFPDEMRGGASIYSAIGRGSLFRVYGSSTSCDTATDASRFRIVLTNLTGDACTKLLFAGNNYQDQSLGIRKVCGNAGCSGGTGWSNEIACAVGICTAAGYTTLPLVAGKCAGAGTANQVGWEFLLRK